MGLLPIHRIPQGLALVATAALMSACQEADHSTIAQAEAGEPATQTLDGASLVAQRCAGCHAGTEEGDLSRIDRIRKTPEGWFMTAVRMEREGRVALSQDERRAVVKHLSDTRGLAPAETADFRYILEKRPNIIEEPADPELGVMCGRCHSNARYSLQRRDADEWRKLVNFHVVQFPTLEYQTMSAERHWFEEATGEFADRLGRLFPLHDSHWDAWKAGKAHDPSGLWRVVGYEPGRGRYEGTAKITGVGGDNFRADYELSYSDGEVWKGQSEALLYTGYEWRGRSQRKGALLREVYALSEDGTRISGRWFHTESDERGGEWNAVRMGGDATVLAVEPAYLKAGETAQIRLFGVGLEGDVDVGSDVSTRIVSRSANEIVFEATASANASPGFRPLRVGSLELMDQLTVYERIDNLKVIPENAIARIGGGGGKLPPVIAQFEAVGYLNGPDGEPATEDDVRIGVFDARWSHDNYDELATELEDARFSGSISASGRFHPAEAGINPERYIATNNVGVLAVTATVDDGDQTLDGTARLVVTVQKFINPPIH